MRYLRLVFLTIVAAVIFFGCAGTKTMVNVRTGEVFEVPCDGEETIGRKKIDPGKQAEELREIGVPEKIIAKAVAGEELMPVERFILANRIKIHNSGATRVPKRSLYNPSLRSWTTLPGYNVQVGGRK